MKQACELFHFRINARQVWAFFQIALPTGERQSVEMCGSAVLFCNNVLQMKRATK